MDHRFQKSRDPLERLSDWREIHVQSAEEDLRKQASRCMDCGVPFCHTGSVINNAASGCPLNNLIPEWNALVSNGDWYEAFQRLRFTNNFPEFTGRVCPAPCEGSCVRSLDEQPVAIKSIECAIADRGLEGNWSRPRLLPRTGRRVAIIGSGPAGLACAEQLNQFGHNVTVFERSDRAGGLLMYGIPNMKLDKNLVTSRINQMRADGISFVLNTNVGEDYPADRLMTEFESVVLCGGAAQPRDLRVPNREVAGVHFAMEYLTESTKSLLDGRSPRITAKNKDVIVIGGGDTGTDCVATSLRQGCRSLVQFEITPQLPTSRSASNPWPQWPRIHRVDYGQQEAINRFGSDPRSYELKTESFLATDDGLLEGVQTVRVQWEGGQLVDLPGSDRRWPAQLVLLAMGFQGAGSNGLISQLGVELRPNGAIKVDAQKRTNVPGVFSAGDMERGQSLVVWAIADGRRAATSVNSYLGSLAQPQASEALYATVS
jgi:glutamate synthase (NADPH) small chain